MVKRSKEGASRNGLIIQMNDYVFFHDIDVPDDLRPLFMEEDRCPLHYTKLDVLRGVRDDFYFAYKENEQDCL